MTRRAGIRLAGGALAAIALGVAAWGIGCGAFFSRSVDLPPPPPERTLWDLTAVDLDGAHAPLARWRGRVALVVNVASECGFTDQYAGLQALQARFEARGLEVLGFPSDEFGGQEPGGPEAIRATCGAFGATFPVFAKGQTAPGPGQSPVYAYLGAATGKLPGWNFCKYVVGRDGRPRGFFASNVDPDDEALVALLERALAEPAPPSPAGATAPVEGGGGP